MAMLLEQADPEALIAHRETVAAYLQTGALLESLCNGDDKPMDSFIGHYASPAAYQASLDRLLEFASAPNGSSPLHQARAYWCAAQLLQRPDHPAANSRTQADHCMALAFSKIAEASEPQRDLPSAPHAGCGAKRRPGSSSPTHISPGLRIEAASPVRLDLAGGWTDTPPYCYERGGQVINLAINLNNQPPVRAMVRTLREPVLILESNDLGTHVELSATEPLCPKVDVHDPFALHKVALDMVGLLPPSHRNLQSHLKKLGAGLIVSTECRVPKGSGLGTSSILAATLLAALYETINRPASTDQLIAQTLLLEQRLSTGGGWQDQVGGIVGGVKSTTTTPGIPQVPVVEPLPLSDELYTALQERFVVYYSGQQRLARDILRRVMGRYLAREPAILFLMEDLKKSAQSLRHALLKGNWPAAAREMARYWEIKKQLYPGSTTPTIDVLFLELREHYLAAGLAGAGGGGFSYFFCKDARQANRLREQLAALSSRPGSLGTLFQTQINRTGLAVTRKST
jgi:galactokinase/mevalonate kinase-like predicted kinase